MKMNPFGFFNRDQKTLDPLEQQVQQAYVAYDPLRDVSGKKFHEANRVSGYLGGDVVATHRVTLQQAIAILQDAKTPELQHKSTRPGQ